MKFEVSWTRYYTQKAKLVLEAESEERLEEKIFDRHFDSEVEQALANAPISAAPVFGLDDEYVIEALP